MFEITLSEELKSKCPGMVLGTIFCRVKNSKHNNLLWDEIETSIEKVKNNYKLENIKDNPQIHATREVYKACGKKPARYRPSAEALMRRILKGQGLYKINTLVDLINLISIETGFSIGGFDADKVQGNVAAGIAKTGEEYEGIGRGDLNIAGLPVLMDGAGPIGTPTSDEERTKIHIETTHFYMNINGYTGELPTKQAMDYSVEMLRKYVEATEIETKIIY